MSPAENTRCEANTKKHGTQCENGDASWCEAQQKMLCHLHHPDARFRQQVAAKRAARLKRMKPLNVERHLPDLDLTSVRTREAEEDAKTGTPILDRPFCLPPSAGKADPDRPSKTLFRKS